jgi:hypothetical protein
MQFRARTILALLLMSFGASALATTVPETKKPPYFLKIADDRISLRVDNGSVLTLVEDLGRRLGFEVIAQGVEDERVTLDFQDFSPARAIREICKGVGYVEVPDLETGRTVKIVLTPGASSAKNRLAARREPLAPRADPPPIEEPPVVPEPEPEPDQKPQDQEDDRN